VVIDAYAYYRNYNVPKPVLRSLSGDQKMPSDPKGKSADTNCGRDEEHSADTSSDTSSMVDVHEDMVAISMPAKVERVEDLSPMSDEGCLLATPWVIGMDMKTKDWGNASSLIQACQQCC
jgi:hypothetical protein